MQGNRDMSNSQPRATGKVTEIKGKAEALGLAVLTSSGRLNGNPNGNPKQRKR